MTNYHQESITFLLNQKEHESATVTILKITKTNRVQYILGDYYLRQRELTKYKNSIPRKIC
jgi:hypothetical protein